MYIYGCICLFESLSDSLSIWLRVAIVYTFLQGPSTTSNLDGEYAVSRQADFQEKSLPVRQKRRTSASSPSGPQNKVKNEEIYRMSSL